MESPGSSDDFRKKRHHRKARIGPKYQADVPSLVSSVRIKHQEFHSRDSMYACGLPVPCTSIAVPPPPATKRKISSYHERSYSEVALPSMSTLDSRSPALNAQEAEDNDAAAAAAAPEPEEHISNGGVYKDANSCASSTKETSLTWKQQDYAATTPESMLEDGSQGAAEQDDAGQAGVDESGLTYQSATPPDASGATFTTPMKKRRKKRSYKRSCWQPKRRVTKKPRLMDNCASQSREEKEEVDSYCKIKFVPGSSHAPWTEAEVARFTLGLYLFAKKFDVISKLLGTKEVKDVIHFYYSNQFYGKPAYYRWIESKIRPDFKDCKDSEYAEMRARPKVHHTRRCIRGELVLQDSRQVEFIKRLEPLLSDDSMHEVLEVARAFNEAMAELPPSVDDKDEEHKKLAAQTFEMFIFRLKEVVGLDNFVQCVGIGGLYKRDLTSGSYPVNNSLVRKQSKEKSSTFRAGKPDIMHGSLARKENLGRNKAPSKNRHFWEVVWPRLLQAGWRLEQNNLPTSSSRGTTSQFLFMRPEVNKTRRERRGVDYFDSVSDLEKAVGNDPSLMYCPPEVARDGSEVQDQEEEAGGRGWSDDDEMFETLDGKGKVVPKPVPSPTQARAAEDSSESSSLIDIDLNRTLCAVNSKPHGEELDEPVKDETLIAVVTEEEPGLPHLNRITPSEQNTYREKNSGFPLGGIDLNELPVEADDMFDASCLETNAGLEHEFLHHGSPLIQPYVPVADLDGTEMELTLSIGFLSSSRCAPVPPIVSTEGTHSEPESEPELANQGEASLPYTAIEREVTLYSRDELFRPIQEKNREVRETLVARGMDIPRQRGKRLRASVGEWIGTGIELVSVAKKRQISLEFIPRSLGMLGELPTTIVITLDGAAAKFDVTPQSGLGSLAHKSLLPGNPKWTFTLSHIKSSNAMAVGGLGHGAQKVLEDRNSLSVPKCRVVEVGDDLEPILADENEGIHGPESATLSPVPIRHLYVKDTGVQIAERRDRPVVSNSRSKIQRVPRKFSSADSKLSLSQAKPKPWPWSLTPDNYEMSSVAESLNSCLTTDGKSPQGRLQEEAPQGAQLRVKNEDSDHLMSPSSSKRSWSTGIQEDPLEDIISEDFGEEKPFLAECKTSRETFSSSADHSENSLFKITGVKKSRSESSTLRRRGFYLTVDSENRRSSAAFDVSDVCDTSGKRAKLSSDNVYDLRSSDSAEQDSQSEGKVSEGDEDNPNQDYLRVEDDFSVEPSIGPKARTKARSPPTETRQKNFYCIWFSSVFLCANPPEEDLPVYNCSSQGPFKTPLHSPHSRGKRPAKARRRRPSLPSRNKTAVSPQTTDVKATMNSSPKRLPEGPVLCVEEEATAAIPALKWPEQDVRFSLRRTSSDVSSKAGRRWPKRGGGRWQHWCAGC